MTNSSSSIPTQMSVTCGLPSRLSVVRCASGPFSICSRTDCGIFIYASLKFQNEKRLPARKAALPDACDVRASLIARVGRDAQVRLHDFVAFGEFLFENFLVLQRRHDDAIIALLPVGRGRDRVLVGELQRIDRA